MVVTLEDPCDQDLFELVNYLSFLALVNDLPYQTQTRLQDRGQFHSPNQH
jgi:hypothetical protein